MDFISIKDLESQILQFMKFFPPRMRAFVASSSEMVFENFPLNANKIEGITHQPSKPAFPHNLDFGDLKATNSKN
jgi:hypothetical protein